MDRCIYCMEKSEQDRCPYCGRLKSEYIPESHVLPPGTLLNSRYLIGRVIGEGGFGITYTGYDTLLQFRVAVKEFYPVGMANRSSAASCDITELSNRAVKEVFQKNRERFLYEARLLAKFYNEPGVVSVKDFFEENHTVYIIMEYLDGITLKDYLKQVKVISYDNTVCLLMPVIFALEKVHNSHLIHRDISPDNIMLVDEQVKLIDFGAAREFTDENSVSVMLKHGYAPMEQYSRHGVQGAWTDIYALCATMYKCITGKAPPDANDRVYYNKPVPLPSACGISIDPVFETVLMHGLALRQEDRIQSIENLLEDLRKVPSLEIPDLLQKTGKICPEPALLSDTENVNEERMTEILLPPPVIPPSLSSKISPNFTPPLRNNFKGSQNFNNGTKTALSVHEKTESKSSPEKQTVGSKDSPHPDPVFRTDAALGNINGDRMTEILLPPQPKLPKSLPPNPSPKSALPSKNHVEKAPQNTNETKTVLTTHENVFAEKSESNVSSAESTAKPKKMFLSIAVGGAASVLLIVLLAVCLPTQSIRDSVDVASRTEHISTANHTTTVAQMKATATEKKKAETNAESTEKKSILPKGKLTLTPFKSANFKDYMYLQDGIFMIDTGLLGKDIIEVVGYFDISEEEYASIDYYTILSTDIYRKGESEIDCVEFGTYFKDSQNKTVEQTVRLLFDGDDGKIFAIECYAPFSNDYRNACISASAQYFGDDYETNDFEYVWKINDYSTYHNADMIISNKRMLSQFYLAEEP